MVRRGCAHLLVMVVMGVFGVSCAVDEEEDVQFPSLMTALGGKLALADDYYDDPVDEAPAPCCFPLTWQGRAVHQLAVSARDTGRRGRSGPMLSLSMDEFFVDGSNRRLAGNKIEFHGHHGQGALNFSWIFSVSANRTGSLYIFDRKAQKCEHRVLHNAVWGRQCLPSNATLRGSFSLGPVSGGLRVQSWSFGGRKRAPRIDGDNHLYPPPGVAFGANVVVVPGSCIPVLMEEHGFICRGIDQQNDQLSGQMHIEDTGLLDNDDSNYESYVRRVMNRTTTDRPHPGPRPGPPRGGVGFSAHAFFSDIETHISDPSVFTVPAYCKKGANTLQFGEQQLPTILERFIVL